MKITFLDRDTIGPTVDIVRPQADHQWQAYDRTAPELVAERIADADIVITNKAPIRAEQLATAKNLKMISIAATGYDVIDIEACKQAGVTVSNVRGYAENTVPEHTFSLILALRRGIIGYRQDVINGEWQKADQFCFFNHPIRDLAGSRIGILGEGVIGQGVARIARAFGMEPVFAAHKGVDGLGPLYTPWQEVMETSDVITCHAPLMPSTKHMISTPEFEAMKKKPLLINTSRGGLVDEAALVDALERGLIAGAGFDVLTKEPPAPDNPILRVLERPNFILTPHVAWASEEAMTEVWRQTIEAVDQFIEGNSVRVLT
jgi:glycerate dehydrogenase